MPTQIDITNAKGQIVHLSHAGFDVWNPPKCNDDYLWDREHFLKCEMKEHNIYENHIMVHGHTPVLVDQFAQLHNQKKKTEVIWYDNNQKLNIDLGCFYTHKIALVNIDTWEVVYFEDNQ